MGTNNKIKLGPVPKIRKTTFHKGNKTYVRWVESKTKKK